MKRLLGVLFALMLVFSLAAIGLSSPVQAAVTFTVNSTSDDVDWNPGDGVAETAPGNGVCTLRAAIQETNALAGPDTINLPAGTYTLSIAGADEDASATGDLDITDNLTITGAGQDITFIDGGGINRVLHILSGSVDIYSVTVWSGGNNRWGGGIHNRGTLMLSNSTIGGNIAKDQGGGIYNVATLTLIDSAISGNTPSGIYNNGTTTLMNSTVNGNNGRGIRNDFGAILTIINSTINGNSDSEGGGIYNSGTTTLTNSTISGNVATTWDGGGINSIGSFTSLTLTNCTISNNQASRSGGGIKLTLSAPVQLKNTIVANNSGGDFGGAVITSLGHNLDSDGTGALGAVGDLSNTDPLLGPLADNGGPTFTHGLLPGSPAIDAGDNIDCPATDQRGIARPLDGDGDGTATVDIGAYEYAPVHEGLVAYYPFNGNADDESGNGNNGTVYGATLTEDRFGNPNSAYSFDGVDDYVNVMNLPITDGVTVGAWVKAASFDSQDYMDPVVSQHGFLSGFELRVGDGHAVMIVTTGGVHSIADAGQVLAVNEWYHLAGTYDGNEFKIYVNSVLKKATFVIGTITKYSGSLNIGRNSYWTNRLFNGAIDEVAIYNRALSNDEIQELYYEGLAGLVINPPAQDGFGEAGTTVTYAMRLINLTGADDSFDLSVSGNDWSTSLSTDNTGPISNGESVSFTVEVDIPTTATQGDVDTATITAMSVSDPAIADTATVTTTATPSQGIISIRSYIDGRSLLIIRVNTAQWHHLDWAAPGRLDFVCFPTVINGSEWYPEWPDVPDEENRRECFSSIYEDLDPALPETEVEVELRVIQARHSISIAQHPSIDNDYTLIVDFNDNPLGGADWYECELTVNVLIVEATVDFDPDTLNLKSKGKVVTVYIELPEGYDVEEIDISTVMLNGIVPAWAHPTDVGDYDSDGVLDLMVKFDRSNVQDMLEPGNEVEVTVSGQLTDGTSFEGADTIRVIAKGKK